MKSDQQLEFTFSSLSDRMNIKKTPMKVHQISIIAGWVKAH